MKKKQNIICKKYVAVGCMLFMLFYFQNSNSQNFTQTQADSIIKNIDAVKEPLEKIKILTSTAGKNRYTKPTFTLLKKALFIAKEQNEPLLLAHSNYAIGNYYYYSSQTDSSLAYLKKAEEFAINSEDPILKTQILATKAGLYSKQGDIILAISTNIEANKLLDNIDTLKFSKEDKIKFHGQRLVLNNALANLYNKTEDFKKAITYYDKAYKSALKLGSNANASIILGNKGDLLIKMGQPKKAISVLQESKKMKQESGLPLRFIGTSHLNLASAYSQLKEYDKALKYYDTAYTIFIEKKNQDGLMRVTTNRGVLYNKINLPELALLDCTKGKKIAEEINDTEFIYQSCNCLYFANKKLGNFTEALKNHEQYTAVKDSLFNEKNIRKITQVGMQYEFDKKEAQQNLKIEKEKQSKNLILAGLIVSGLILIGLFIFFKKRIKYQKTIATQNEALQKQKITELQQKNKLTALNSMIEGQEAERLRIAKDLHDTLGGLLSTIKAHFTGIQNQCNEISNIPLTQKTNQLIDQACLSVRRVSHNMMPHSLRLSGLSGAFEDLGEQLEQQGYNINLEIQNIPSNIEETKKIMLYRIAQEVLTNIRKHADAASILVQLIGSKNQLTLIIEDDGKGFKYNEAYNKGGVGIENINSRVSYLDGTIVWDSEIGKGTTVTINIPL